jgi:glycosyltransferase involved in cell wall biosynthesis
VQDIVVSDDGSTDDTKERVYAWSKANNDRIVDVLYNDHTGLPETVKKIGVEYIRYTMGNDTWVLMLDADERIDEETMHKITQFVQSDDLGTSHVWFTLDEYIDGKGPLRTFIKCRLFRANAIQFSDSVHEDDVFYGQGARFDWKVVHRKTSSKQTLRENEYIETYKKLLAEGKVTQEWVERCIGFHYFVKEAGLVPHG